MPSKNKTKIVMTVVAMGLIAIVTVWGALQIKKVAVGPDKAVSCKCTSCKCEKCNCK